MNYDGWLCNRTNLIFAGNELYSRETGLEKNVKVYPTMLPMGSRAGQRTRKNTNLTVY